MTELKVLQELYEKRCEEIGDPGDDIANNRLWAHCNAKTEVYSEMAHTFNNLLP